MCGFTLWVTSDNNKCGNYLEFVGDEDNPNNLSPYMVYHADDPNFTACDYPQCRYHPAHKHAPEDQDKTCDQLNCWKGPFYGPPHLAWCDRSKSKYCGLLRCKRCRGGKDFQQYFTYKGPALCTLLVPPRGSDRPRPGGWGRH